MALNGRVSNSERSVAAAWVRFGLSDREEGRWTSVVSAGRLAEGKQNILSTRKHLTS